MSSQGRKPAAIIAELEENLADLKTKFLKNEISGRAYITAARPLSIRIRKLKVEAITD